MSVKARERRVFLSVGAVRGGVRSTRDAKSKRERERDIVEKVQRRLVAATNRDIYLCRRVYIYVASDRNERKGERKRERKSGNAVHHRRMKNLAFPDEKRYL